MQERLLHFIWEHQYFDSKGLRSDTGDNIQVISPGKLNHDQGPDFLHAEIIINGIRWRGHVELHIAPRAWKEHGHHKDPRYNNVILHVTWETGQTAHRIDGTQIPTLALQSRTPTFILGRYQQLTGGLPPVPCTAQITSVRPERMLEALDLALNERYWHKMQYILKRWNANGRDWEQTSFEWLSRHFGFNINNNAFETLAASVPVKILNRHRDQPIQIEALLFGMAGMLKRGIKTDIYYNKLCEEFKFLRYKYSLRPRMQGVEWKLLRLRPLNFPTLRIAQLASFLNSLDGNLYDALRSLDPSKRISIGTSPYWETHFDFGKERKKATMSRASYTHLMMNTVIPLTWARSYSRGDDNPIEHIHTILHRIPAEKNRITRIWKKMDIHMQTALDSQAYLSLFKQKCSKRLCLRCPVGTELIKGA